MQNMNLTGIDEQKKAMKTPPPPHIDHAYKIADEIIKGADFLKQNEMLFAIAERIYAIRQEFLKEKEDLLQRDGEKVQMIRDSISELQRTFTGK